MTTLPDLIATYILSQDTPVSLTAIYERAEGRFTDDDVRKAMSVIHKTRRDIKVTVKDDTNWYSKRVLQAPKAPPPRIEQTEEERAMLKDFIDNCPFLSDRERTLMRTPYKDWEEDDHEIMDTPLEFDLYMQRKYGGPKWNRLKEERSLII